MAKGDDIGDMDFDDMYFVLPDAAYSNGRGGRNGRHDSGDEDNGSYKFSPPLYKQRYERVLDEIRKHIMIVDKVVDFGCAEGSFLQRARKSLTRSISILIGVDLDISVLRAAEMKLTPDEMDNLYGNNDDMYDGISPVVTYLYKGSVAEYDDRLAGVDAVVAIELIEHLHDDVLKGAVEMIFSCIRPYLVVFTTPNVEFNVMFNMGDRQFRHDDHKFEWTRKEFAQWCNSITEKYTRYTVEISGIGEGPSGTNESIGCGSQMAVFKYKKTESYLDRKELRMQELRKVTLTNPRAVFEHMTTGTWPSDDGEKAHEHPYEFVARLLMPNDRRERILRRRALADCAEYCRTIYFEHYDQCAAVNEATPSECPHGVIIVDEPTGIRGMWFATEDLFAAIQSVRNVCSKVEDIVSLIISGDDAFRLDGGGFSCSVKRICYQDPNDVLRFNTAQESEQSQDDEDEEEYQGGVDYGQGDILASSFDRGFHAGDDETWEWPVAKSLDEKVDDKETKKSDDWTENISA